MGSRPHVSLPHELQITFPFPFHATFEIFPLVCFTYIIILHVWVHSNGVIAAENTEHRLDKTHGNDEIVQIKF
jgi:hypothetical protein